MENIVLESSSSVPQEKQWSKEHEGILVDWADKAMCFRWLHTHCNRHYTKLNQWFTIPVIVLSTLTGTANFAQQSFPEDLKFMVALIVGSLNIFAGMISTISQFLSVSELNEAHRVSSISWGKFNRTVKVELSKNPEERQNVTQFIKRCNGDYDLLMETSPMIRQDALLAFKKTFTNKTIKTDDFHKPEICDNLTSSSVVIFKNDGIDKDEQAQILELVKQKKLLQKKTELVQTFIMRFVETNNREPDLEEVIENMKVQVDEPTIKSVVASIEKTKNIQLGASGAGVGIV